MRKTDKKITSYNLCLKGHLIGCFPSCLSAAQFNCIVKWRKGFVHCFNLATVKKTLLPSPSPPPLISYFWLLTRMKEKGSYSQNFLSLCEHLDLLLSSCTACLPWYHAILLVRICLPQQWPTLANLVSAFSWLRDCSLILCSCEILLAKTSSKELDLCISQHPSLFKEN